MFLRHFIFSKEIDLIGSSNKLNRDAWISKVLSEIPPGMKILDAGAGKMPYKPFCSHLNYTSQDFCEYDGRGNGSGLQTETFDTNRIDIVSDIAHIPVSDNYYDVILCSEVLEHVPDAVKVMKELIRLLKPEGLLIVTVPFCSLTHYAPYHFASGFNRYFFESFKDSLKIDVLQTNGNYFEYLAQEIKRIPYVTGKYSSVRIGRVQNFFIYGLLNILARINKRSSNSDELLCFGYHFIGKKLV